jgi:hypothetical protein
VRPRRCVILEHRHRGGRHWDWLFEHPGWPADDSAPLWAARLPRLPQRWPDRAIRLLAVTLPDHRRRYLCYQGPLTGGRGTVRRVAAGEVRPIRWRQGRAALLLWLGNWQGRVELRRLTTSRCSVLFYPQSPRITRPRPAATELPMTAGQSSC